MNIVNYSGRILKSSLDYKMKMKRACTLHKTGASTASSPPRVRSTWMPLVMHRTLNHLAMKRVKKKGTK